MAQCWVRWNMTQVQVQCSDCTVLSWRLSTSCSCKNLVSSWAWVASWIRATALEGYGLLMFIVEFHPIAVAKRNMRNARKKQHINKHNKHIYVIRIASPRCWLSKQSSWRQTIPTDPASDFAAVWQRGTPPRPHARTEQQSCLSAFWILFDYLVTWCEQKKPFHCSHKRAIQLRAHVTFLRVLNVLVFQYQ